MPRRIPTQVTQTVSRLLEGGYVKKPPAWFEPTLRHPPAVVPPRQERKRPDADLPHSLRSEARQAALQRADAKTKRSNLNSLKKLRAQLPPLRPQPIVYPADRIRRQFFRDHPWEAKRVSTLVEMDFQLDTKPQPSVASGTLPELTLWSRLNPSVEEYVAKLTSVIQCTLRTSEMSELSLSQAYRRTLASYHAIQAEREHRIRYANVEARALGADLGPSETDRGFIKEQRALDKWATFAGTQAVATGESTPGVSGTAARTKREDTTFTAGADYLKAGATLRAGQAPAPRARAAPTATAQKGNDFLGMAESLR